jgi:phenylacetic acid degradation operon negative regulatory protein
LIDHPAVSALHAETPLRVWSLIVTVFGDMVMREGTDLSPPPVWSGPLTVLMAMVGVEAGPLRTSLSRLVAGGTLLRGKEGRNTFYAIEDDSRRAFANAGATIYGRRRPLPTGFLHLALIDRMADRAAAREALTAGGWRFIGPSTALLPEHDGEAAPATPEGTILGKASCDGAIAEAVSDIFGVAALDAGYARFLDVFAPVAAAPPAEPAHAAALRLLLVHQFRRVALRDPMLPARALPAGWRGEAARRTFDAARGKLRGPSEAWLSANGFRPADGSW